MPWKVTNGTLRCVAVQRFMMPATGAAAAKVLARMHISIDVMAAPKDRPVMYTRDTSMHIVFSRLARSVSTNCRS